MSFFGKWTPALVAATVWAATGCSPMDPSAADEEKEPHYVLGMSRVNAMNYSGAIEAFEEALEVNPHSPAAHFQLAILYDNQESVADPAAAIYHYQRCLKYDPRFQNADAIPGRIENCKQRLAENVLQLPSAPAVQQQLEKLAEENRRLHDQITQWQAYYAAQQANQRTNPPPAPNNYSPQPQGNSATSLTPEDVSLQTPGSTTGGGSSARPATGQRRTTATSTTTRRRTHTVVNGETLASIARKEGIGDWHALETANPGVNPKKLKAGQVLNLPAQ